jgi:hypothetical protein
MPPHQRGLVEVIGKTNYLLTKGMPLSHAHLFKNDGQGAKSCFLIILKEKKLCFADKNQ